MTSFRDRIRADAETRNCKYRITKSGQVDYYGQMPNSTVTGWYFVGWSPREVCAEMSRDKEAAESLYGEQWQSAVARDHLVAAAPDLLAALVALVERGTDSPEHRAAEAAIARAKGAA